MSNPIGSLVERHRLMYEKLEHAPQVKLRGVVGPNGVTAAKMRGESQWSAMIGLEVWRIDGSTARADELTIRRRVTDDQLRWLKDEIRPGLMIAGTIRLADNGVDSPQGLFDRLDLLEPADHELALLAKTLAEPKPIEDEQLGSLALDRRVGWFKGRLHVNGTTVVLNIAPDRLDAPAEAVDTARSVQQALQALCKNASHFAAQRLLAVKNESWLREAEKPMSADDFCKRISLSEVTVFGTGEIDLWFDDDDIFGGHTILVRATVDVGAFDASICG